MKRVKPFVADEQDVKNFNDQGFLRKLARYALRLGRPVVEQLYALYYMLRSDATPMRSKPTNPAFTNFLNEVMGVAPLM